MKTFTQEQIDILVKNASRYTMNDYNEDHPNDEIYPVDIGNYDDAAYSAWEDGQTDMARLVLYWLEIPYTIDKDEY